MTILFKSLHNLSLEGNNPIRKDINDDFEEYLREYIDFSVAENDTKRDNTIPDLNTTVIHCVASIVRGVIEKWDSIDDYSDSIAKKLMTVEKDVQQEILHMGVHVQRGSIIQVLVRDEDAYKFIIAKVEHLEFIEAENFKRDIGFPSENKRVWKSAVIPINYEDGEITFGIVKCYAKSGEKYWSQSFLELEPARTDEVNTSILYNEVIKVLSKHVKKKSLVDYTLLQNSLLSKLQSRRWIDYPILIEDIFRGYQPDNEELSMENVIINLYELQGSGKFDTQFYSAPNAIKKQKRRTYKLSSSIELVVKEGLEELDQSIIAIREPNGDRYLKVTCEDITTFNSFKCRTLIASTVREDM